MLSLILWMGLVLCNSAGASPIFIDFSGLNAGQVVTSEFPGVNISLLGSARIAGPRIYVLQDTVGNPVDVLGATGKPAWFNSNEFFFSFEGSMGLRDVDRVTPLRMGQLSMTTTLLAVPSEDSSIPGTRAESRGRLYRNLNCNPRFISSSRRGVTDRWMLDIYALARHP